MFGIERIDILLRKKEMAVIEQLQISLKELFRDCFVQLLTRVMAFLQKVSDRDCDRFLGCRRGWRRRKRGDKKNSAKRQ